MISKAEEEIIIDKLGMIWVNLNMKDKGTFQITCTRRILGGMGMARSYSAERAARTMLLALGFGEEVIADRLRTLREINAEGVKPYEGVEVGERRVPDPVLHVSGFTAV